MAARPSLFAHGEEAVHRPRHRPAQKQQVPLGVHFHDAEPQLGEVARPHVPGHALPLDDARRIGTRRDRAGLPMACIAVSFGAAVEVMAVHHALEPVTLTRSPAAKIATVNVSPALGASPAIVKLSSTRGAISKPAFFTWPARAFAVRFGFLAPKPSWTCDWPTCTTGHGPASMIVTGTCVPSASNTRVMPSFLPISPVIGLSLLHLDLDVHAGRQIELGQGIDGLGPGIQNVDQPLVRLELELLAALLVDVRAAEHCPELPLGGQGDGPRDLRPGLFRGAHDVGRGLIDQGVVERFETNSDSARHRVLATSRSWWPRRRRRCGRLRGSQTAAAPPSRSA